ncbi:ABC transporter ATP-binding protein [Synoicihabitans lomoniglobus]|uniref:ATP-binding cassette domain-containing protein n=1 Tax=Synoicihabitans lomoniglobus TaxID=2909285 RepID=A0AAE9ZVL1_9BACT|nr:ATP-binding cassette domain-containing protein [Opitutaceae bacterium LMO-M01]WED63899.1 ATP-binding cassette domain-containing protein [Opitutaceae bacterium LMO-M01]
MPLTRTPFPQRDDRNPVTVQVEGMSKSYGTQNVLQDVSLSVEPGEIFVIMGPSGSGKSVLLRHIAGLERPTSGTVTINGADPMLAETRNRFALALVFQSGALLNSLSVYDNLALYPHEHTLCSKQDIRDRVMRALRILSIEHAAQKMPSELSGGMRKRVAIARALVMEPQLLLYDEPTSELDPIMAATIAEIIGTLREEYAVTSIVVSHDRDLSLTIADRVALLHQGQVATIAQPDDLKASTDPIVTEFLNPRIDVRNPRFKSLEGSS